MQWNIAPRRRRPNSRRWFVDRWAADRNGGSHRRMLYAVAS
ncbi:hypothetical protein ABZV65_30400 [Streptomyces bauhiniae]